MKPNKYAIVDLEKINQLLKNNAALLEAFNECIVGEPASKAVLMRATIGDRIYCVDDDGDIIDYFVENVVITDDDVLYKYDSYDGVICTQNNLVNGSLFCDIFFCTLSKEEADKKSKEIRKNETV